jgi:hypothetical protein
LIQRIYRGYIIRHPPPPPTPPIELEDILSEAVSDICSIDTFVSFDGYDNEEDRKIYYKIRQSQTYVPAGVDPKYFTVNLDGNGGESSSEGTRSGSSSDDLLGKLSKKLAVKEPKELIQKKVTSRNSTRKFKLEYNSDSSSGTSDEDNDEDMVTVIDLSLESLEPNFESVSRDKPKDDPMFHKRNATNGVYSQYIDHPLALSSPQNAAELKKWNDDKKKFMFEIAYDPRLTMSLES